jgi:hypothetical protein
LDCTKKAEIQDFDFGSRRVPSSTLKLKYKIDAAHNFIFANERVRAEVLGSPMGVVLVIDPQ